ncbi:MAG: hypothetical protein R8P61_26130 [Bacteroidia bacterium]|nr:hypothetical protein [Bacteroidia bacterium]
MNRLQKIFLSKKILLPFSILLLLFLAYALLARYKGQVEYVTFESDIRLEGVLSKPHNQGPHPAVIILHGSGASHQEYDKLFNRLHANAFVEKGFASLAYTKRGSGKNEIDYRYFTYKDLMKDAMAALDFLRSRPDIDHKNIGIMAISESGWFSPELAARDSNIRFIVNRVSSPFNVPRTLSHEIRMDAKAEGFTEKEIEEDLLPMHREIWQYYIEAAKDLSQDRTSLRDSVNGHLSKLHNSPKFSKWFVADKLSPYDPKLIAARGSNYSYDPLPYLRASNTPFLYVMGGKDRNMPSQEIISFLEEFRVAENKEIEIKLYPDASHYLYKWSLRDGPFEGLYVEGYLDLITNWAKKQIRD